MMSFSKRSIWLAVAAVGAIQTAVLVSMVWGRVHLLTNGREIVVDVVPVDPRDIFRGDYVILNYDFSNTGEVLLPAGMSKGDRAYATIAKTAEDKWQVRNVSAAYPDNTGPDDVVLKGIVEWAGHRRPELGPTAGQLRYGIESYFVPEGTGRPLEEKVQQQRIQAVLAVGRKGDVAIKGLKVDGELIHQESAL